MAAVRSSVLYLAHRAFAFSAVAPGSSVLARAASTAASSDASAPPPPRAKFTISAKARPGEPTVVTTPSHEYVRLTRELYATHTIGTDLCRRLSSWCRFFIDEPAKLGGHDKGPSPLLYAVGALAGCEAVTSRAVARDMGIEVQELAFDVTGAIDPRGFRGVPGIPSHFQTVRARSLLAGSDQDDRN